MMVKKNKEFGYCSFPAKTPTKSVSLKRFLINCNPRFNLFKDCYIKYVVTQRIAISAFVYTFKQELR